MLRGSALHFAGVEVIHPIRVADAVLKAPAAVGDPHHECAAWKKKIYQVFRYGRRAVAAGHRYGSGSLALG